ncbi:MAG: type II secretion system F family protein [Anaerolineae bacterium]|nr:type II secretion system F family protein [Anaerolineae bacterium]
MTAKPAGLSVQVYRALLLLYPAEHRREYGDWMAQVFRDQYRAAVRQRGSAGIAGLWLHTLGDLIPTLIQEHLSTLQTRRTHPMDTTPFDRQLVGSINLWIRGLRQGYSVRQMIEIVSQHAPEPTASAFCKLAEELRAGENFEDTLQRLEREIPSASVQQFTETMRVQLREGGNLADRLEDVNRFLETQVEGENWSDDVHFEG